MITKKVVYFWCDWCLKEGQSEPIEYEAQRLFHIFLPEEWVGKAHEKSFCSELCEAKFDLQRAEEKITPLLEAEEEEAER